jgi:hypothetical protein
MPNKYEVFFEKIAKASAKERDSRNWPDDKKKTISEEDILEVMKAQNVSSLPASLRAFLKFMPLWGYGFYDSHHEEDFEDLLEMKTKLQRKIFFHNDYYKTSLTMPDNIFVFLTRLSDLYYHIPIDVDNDNPPVFYFFPEMEQHQVEASFTDFIEKYARVKLRWKISLEEQEES